MTTHEVEEMLDITKKTLIYYENEGLVKPSRDNNNYRCYNQDDISKIKFPCYELQIYEDDGVLWPADWDAGTEKRV